MLRSLPRLTPASYTRPTRLLGSTGLAPRQLLPLLQHPAQSSAPQQPPRPALPTPSGWQSSNHAAPAAYPRSIPSAIGTNSRASHPFSSGNGQPAKESKETKEERNQRLTAEKERCIAARHNAPVWPLADAVKAAHHPLWCAAERWVNSDQRADGLTLITTHACGFSKESWRPVFAKLFPLLSASEGRQFGTGEPLPTGAGAERPHINELWFLEDTNHGVSVDLNAGKLGDALCWDDSARELINFVENVLPSVGSEAPFQLPLELNGKSAEQAGQTPTNGAKRRIIGVGHSYGGNALAQAAAARPELFEAILLVEPMTVPSLVNAGESGSPLTLGALKRRAEWPSLEDAGKVRSNALFSRWEEEQFGIWLSHYLVPSEAGDGVTLATPTWAEAQTFSEPDAPMRGWECLPKLSMPVGFLMAGDETWMTGETVAQELVWRPQRARNERIMDASHLVIQERPQETAESVDRFLRTLPTWDESPQQ